MATINYPVGQLFDDAGTLLSAPLVTVASVTDVTGTAIGSSGASVNPGTPGAAPVSVGYDAEAHGEAWITLSVSQSGHTITGANASPAIYCAKDSSRIITELDTNVGSRATVAGVAAALPTDSSIAADAASAISATAPLNSAGVATLLTRITGSLAPTTGDAYARLGAPAGASVSADIAAANLSLSLSLSLLGQNSGVRNQQYDGSGNLISADICAYDNPTHAALNDGATGLAHKWSLALTYSGGAQSTQSLAQVS